MKGITRKKLIALLSAVGLAGTTASSTAQVVKGSQPGDKTQTSSTTKSGKSNQENQAATNESLGKGEQKKWDEANSSKNDAAIKSRKAGGERQANKDVVSEKVGPDHIVHKHVAGVKFEKSQAASTADAGSKDAKTKSGKITPDYTRHKKGQAQAETNSLHQEADVKGGRTLDAGSKDAAKMSKASKEKSASTDSINKKEHKTQVHTNALTVKQKTGAQSNLPQPQPDQKIKSETPK